MPNRKYANGANFERRVKARLEADGWTVFRTAGSHSPADLVALRHPGVPFSVRGDVALVQCKGGVTKMGPKAKREFAAFADSVGAEAWVAERGLKLSRVHEVREEVA